MGRHEAIEAIPVAAPYMDVEFVAHSAGSPPEHTSTELVLQTPAEAPAVAQTQTEEPEARIYHDNVDLVAAAARITIDEGVDRARSDLLIEYHDKAKDIDFWGSVSQEQASQAAEIRGAVMDELGPSWHNRSLADTNDPCDRALIRLAMDIRGSTDPQRAIRPSDAINFATGVDLVRLIDSDVLQDPAALTKATLTIRALIATGLDKFSTYESDRQLLMALSVMEQYAQRVPNFDLEAAGLGDARLMLGVSRAALQVDNMTKSGHQLSDRSRLFEVTHNGLETLAHAEAYGLIHGAEQNGTLDELLADALNQVEATDSGSRTGQTPHQYAGGHRK